MNCSACGADLLPNARFCTRCGVSPGGSASSAAPTPALAIQVQKRSGAGNVLLGFFLVEVRFFTLPISFMADTFRLLARIGERGSVEESIEPDLPFTSWFIVAGQALAVVTAILGFLALVVVALAVGDAGSILIILAALGGAFAWLWVWGIIIEATHLAVLVVRNPRRSAEAL